LKKQRTIKKWREMLFRPTYLYLIIIFLSSFLPWILIDRTDVFLSFFTRAPLLVLLVTWPVYLFSLTIKSNAQRQVLIFHFVFWPVLIAMIFYPHWTALPVPERAAHYLYFLLASWR
jgi:hypothetical protein